MPATYIIDPKIASSSMTALISFARSLLVGMRVDDQEGLRGRVVEVKQLQGEAQICVLKGRPR